MITTRSCNVHLCGCCSNVSCVGVHMLNQHAIWKHFSLKLCLSCCSGTWHKSSKTSSTLHLCARQRRTKRSWLGWNHLSEAYLRICWYAQPYKWVSRYIVLVCVCACLLECVSVFMCLCVCVCVCIHACMYGARLFHLRACTNMQIPTYMHVSCAYVCSYRKRCF